MEAFFAYELSPQPPSLFPDGVMRKTTKSHLTSCWKVWLHSNQTCQRSASSFYISGTYFTQSSTYDDGMSNALWCWINIYFDGYSSVTSTKVVEERRRAQMCTCYNIFDDNTRTTTFQAAFLANHHSKKGLIQALWQIDSSEVPVIIIGTDTDLLVMSSMFRAAPYSNTYCTCNILPRLAHSIQSCA